MSFVTSIQNNIERRANPFTQELSVMNTQEKQWQYSSSQQQHVQLSNVPHTIQAITKHDSLTSVFYFSHFKKIQIAGKFEL